MDIKEVRDTLLECSQVDRVDLQESRGGMLKIIFMRKSELMVRNWNGFYSNDRTLYGLNFALFLNPLHRDEAGGNDYGICPQGADGRIKAKCPQDAVGATLLRYDQQFPDGRSYCLTQDQLDSIEDEETEDGADADPFAGTHTETDIDAQTEQEFQNTIGNCPEPLKSNAQAYCADCQDRGDGLGDLGFNACLFDACGMGEVSAAEAARDMCRAERKNNTPPAVQDLMITQMVNEFDKDPTDGTISRGELNTIIGGCE